MSKIIGIDLGTTNSCVAVYEGGERVIIPNAQGGRTTPSVVAFTKDGERLIGETAKRQAAVNPDRTISSIKRDMGTERRISIDGKQYSPQEISAMILRQLKSDAETYLGEPVTEAVITVPAYFTDAQRQDRQAGKGFIVAHKSCLLSRRIKIRRKGAHAPFLFVVLQRYACVLDGSAGF